MIRLKAAVRSHPEKLTNVLHTCTCEVPQLWCFFNIEWNSETGNYFCILIYRHWHQSCAFVRIKLRGSWWRGRRRVGSTYVSKWGERYRADLCHVSVTLQMCLMRGQICQHFYYVCVSHCKCQEKYIYDQIISSFGHNKSSIKVCQFWDRLQLQTFTLPDWPTDGGKNQHVACTSA